MHAPLTPDFVHAVLGETFIQTEFHDLDTPCAAHDSTKVMHHDRDSCSYWKFESHWHNARELITWSKASISSLRSTSACFCLTFMVTTSRGVTLHAHDSEIVPLTWKKEIVDDSDMKLCSIRIRQQYSLLWFPYDLQFWEDYDSDYKIQRSTLRHIAQIS